MIFKQILSNGKRHQRIIDGDDHTIIPIYYPAPITPDKLPDDGIITVGSFKGMSKEVIELYEGILGECERVKK